MARRSRIRHFPVARLGPWLILGGGLGCGQAGPLPDTPAASVPAADPPRLQISRAERELGEIPVKTHVETFEIRNLGEQPLVIGHVERSCSCVDVSLPRSTIPPGEMTRLEVTIAPRKSEARTGTITIHSNDPLLSTTRIRLSWTARGAVSAEPHELQFGVVRPDVAASQTVRVKQDLRQLERPVPLQVRASPGGLLKARRIETVETEHEVIETWTVTLQASREQVESQGLIWLAEDGKNEPHQQLPVFWQVREPIDVAPSSLFLGSAAPDQRLERAVDITCDPDKTLEIAELEGMGDEFALTWRFERITPRHTRIHFEAIFPDRPGAYLKQVRIHLQAPTISTVELPVSCVVLGKEPSPSR
jgi:hypothetical protein